MLQSGCPGNGGSSSFNGSLTDILVQRINQLGWTVTTGWVIEDLLGVFCLESVHLHALLFRIQWAWTFVIHRHVQHRESFQSFCQVDRELTRQDLLGLEDYSIGILTRHLNGSSFANDVVWRWSEEGSDQCRFCGEPDSVFHRLWTCPASADLRDRMDPTVLEFHQSFPAVLSVHGWTLKSPYWLEWLRYLDALSSGIPSPCRSLPSGGIVDLFTDGSCYWQHESRYRLAAWAVVLAPPLDFSPDPQGCHVLAASPLGGICQTSFRAELQAFLVALDFACRDRLFVRVWTDCLSLTTRFKMLVSGLSQPKRSQANSDLWFAICERVEVLGQDHIQVVKVPAHENTIESADAFENWMITCNNCADRAAKAANLGRSEAVWSLWERHMAAVERNRTIGLAVREHMVAVAERWTGDWKQSAPAGCETKRSVRVHAPSWPVTNSLVVVKPTFRRLFGETFLRKVEAWFDQLWTVTEPVRWVSYAQLFLSYQLTCRDCGVWKQSGKWYVLGQTEGSTGEQFRFSSLCKYFRLMLQQYLKDCGVKYQTMATRPFSQMLQCHIGCLGLPIQLIKQQEVERWLESKLSRPLRGSSSKLVLPMAI